VLEMPFYATVGLISGLHFFFQGFRDLRRLRLIENTPTARIRSMAMGLVEINGHVEGRSTAFAPFSGKPCAYWQVEIAVRSGRRNSWSTIHRNSSGQPFFLSDDTGVALVYPKGADCQVGQMVEETANGLTLPSCYSDYMKENGLWMRYVAGLSSLRFRERTIESGDRVYVLGTAVPRPQVLTVSEIQLAATGTDDARATPIRQRDTEVVAIVRRGEAEKTFIISQRSERSLTTQLQWVTPLKLVGGPILTLFGLGWWLVRLSKGI
jgi:E3 Ubiquitin ligase